jgi:hypothetical protein
MLIEATLYYRWVTVVVHNDIYIMDVHTSISELFNSHIKYLLSKLAQTIIYLTCNLEVPSLNLGQDTGCTDKVFLSALKQILG